MWEFFLAFERFSLFQEVCESRKLIFPSDGTFLYVRKLVRFLDFEITVCETRIKARGLCSAADRQTCAMLEKPLCLQTIFIIFSRRSFTTERLFRMFTFSLSERRESRELSHDARNDEATHKRRREKSEKMWKIFSPSRRDVDIFHFPFIWNGWRRIEMNLDFFIWDFLWFKLILTRWNCW